MTDVCLFVLKEEFVSIIEMLAHRRELRACLSLKGTYKLFEMHELSFNFLDNPVGPQLFLCPKSQALLPPLTRETIQPRYMGWIQVAPGGLCVFEETQIVTMSMLQAENHSEVVYKPATWLRQLKKDLAKQLRMGVYGESVTLGRGRDYPDIFYSDAALEVAQSGGIWRQYPNNRITFYRPMD